MVLLTEGSAFGVSLPAGLAGGLYLDVPEASAQIELRLRGQHAARHGEHGLHVVQDLRRDAVSAL